MTDRTVLRSIALIITRRGSAAPAPSKYGASPSIVTTKANLSKDDTSSGNIFIRDCRFAGWGHDHDFCCAFGI